MRKILLALFIGCTLLAIAGCSNKPRVLASPQVLIQSLALTQNGGADTRLLLHNFSNVPLTFVRLDVSFRIQGKLAAQIDLPMEMEIPAESPDNINTTIEIPESLRSALAASLPLPYTLEGTISTRKPRRRFEFIYRGVLNPTPGVAGAWR